MKRVLLFLAAALTFSVATAQHKKAQVRPNFLIYVVEGLGWQDTSVPFWKEKTHRNEMFNTPNFEKLASQGVKFTRSYTTSPFSDSASACALTGIYHWSKIRENRVIKEELTNLTTVLQKNGYEILFSEKRRNQFSDQTKTALDYAIANRKPFFLEVTQYNDYEIDKTDVSKNTSKSDTRVKKYAENADQTFGKIVEYLEYKEVFDNTIIIFVTHNGLHNKEFSHPKKDYPLNGEKGSIYEGGIRIQTIIKSPYNTQLRECDTPISLIDCMPTILEMAGVRKYKTSQKLEGMSLAPLLINNGTSKKFSKRALYWHYIDEPEIAVGKIADLRYGPASAIIQNDWKLIHFYDTRKSVLFNLKDDIFEIVDQYENSSAADVRKKLENRLTHYLGKTRATIPVTPGAEFGYYPNGSKYYKTE